MRKSLFSEGLDDPEKNCFAVLLRDCDGNVVYNLTGDLHLEFVNGGNDKRKCQTGVTAGVESNSQTVSNTPVNQIIP
ncbi:28456_t:CDS:2 [Dentiscutata erythropus]|uniref:28456_t:CDS:1 n=1 Tax=Dentiscutata erythropus TaxID=1348616 RepID=A0A9N8YVA9_9GLOM|nr:28456_t:CDS:2 [Dentiscutata erythropus]